MKQSNYTDAAIKLREEEELEELYNKLLLHIHTQNKTRMQYVENVELGDPVWDILLDLKTSRYLNRPATTSDIAERLEIPKALCERILEYLVRQKTISKNPEPFSLTGRQFILSEETEDGLKKWLDECIAETPSF